MVASGAEVCVRASSQLDLTKESKVAGTDPHVLLLLVIEVRDKYDGAMNNHTSVEIIRCLDDISKCPRETVRFFHRRNHCDCLKELYYDLKETTPRTSSCWHCHKVVDI
eukprot:scaffold49682_cov53-Cyclotella_meneghiniana.AAC.6